MVERLNGDWANSILITCHRLTPRPLFLHSRCGLRQKAHNSHVGFTLPAGSFLLCFLFCVILIWSIILWFDSITVQFLLNDWAKGILLLFLSILRKHHIAIEKNNSMLTFFTSHIFYPEISYWHISSCMHISPIQLKKERKKERKIVYFLNTAFKHTWSIGE